MSILVVLDTNVVVSAGIRPGGAPARIIAACLDDVLIPVISPCIAKEYHRVVTRPKFQRWNFPPTWLLGLLESAHRLENDPPPWPHAGPDADDLIFLAAAYITGATVVTGNMSDFPKQTRQSVSVRAPQDYLADLAQHGIHY